MRESSFYFVLLFECLSQPLRQFRKDNTNTARLFEAVGIVAAMQSVTEGGMKQPQWVVTID